MCQHMMPKKRPRMSATQMKLRIRWSSALKHVSPLGKREHNDMHGDEGPRASDVDDDAAPQRSPDGCLGGGFPAEAIGKDR